MTTFIASLYAWEVPSWHNAALLNDGIHYLMHVTMLVAGLFFWWLVLDRRPPPQGLRHGVRLMMLWLAILSNIILGGYTALKHDVLYTAYDRSEEHTSELQSLMRISYAVFCLKKKKTT